MGYAIIEIIGIFIIAESVALFLPVTAIWFGWHTLFDEKIAAWLFIIGSLIYLAVSLHDFAETLIYTGITSNAAARRL